MLRDKIVTETISMFRRPTTVASAAEHLEISKQAVLRRLQLLGSLGAEFKITLKQVTRKGPPSKLWCITKEPEYR